MVKILRENYKLAILYSIVAIVILSLSVIFKANFLPTIFSLLTLFGVFMNSVFSRNGQLLFAISAVVYIAMSYKAAFYGEIILYSFFFIFYVSSFLRWKRKAFQIKSLTRFQTIIMLIFGSVFTPAYYFLLSNINTSQILLNSISTTIACLAVFSTTNKKWQQFYFWTAISFVQIILWLTTFTADNMSNLPVIIANSFLFSINFYNLIKWRKKYLSQQVTEQIN